MKKYKSQVSLEGVKREKSEGIKKEKRQAIKIKSNILNFSIIFYWYLASYSFHPY